MKLAIFDFDETISDRDSFLDLIIFAYGKIKTGLGLLVLSPTIVLYLLHLSSRGKTKGRIFTFFFKGWEEHQFQKLAQDYVQNRLDKIVRPNAQERLDWHKAQGHSIIVVSASFEEYLGLWCRKQGIDILATRIEIQNGKLTGKLATPNCHGLEKVNRLAQRFQLKDFEYIYAYGDSKGDLALKNIAHEFHYRIF